MRTAHILVVVSFCFVPLACKATPADNQTPSNSRTTPPPTPPQGVPTMSDLDRAEGELARLCPKATSSVRAQFATP